MGAGSVVNGFLATEFENLQYHNTGIRAIYSISRLRELKTSSLTRNQVHCLQGSGVVVLQGFQYGDKPVNIIRDAAGVCGAE